MVVSASKVRTTAMGAVEPVTGMVTWYSAQDTLSWLWTRVTRHTCRTCRTSPVRTLAPAPGPCNGTEGGAAHGGVNPGAHGRDPAVEAVLARLEINAFIIPSLQQGPPGATHPGTANPATDVANEDVLVTVLVGQRAAAVTLEME